MHFLMVRAPGRDSYRYELKTDSVTLGRSGENDLVLEDATVSRYRHAQIERRIDGDYIVPLESRNGTIVNGRRLTEPARLGPGDSIRLGETVLVYDGTPSAEVEFDTDDHELRSTTIVSAEEIRQMLAPQPDAISDMAFILKADRVLVETQPLEAILQTIMDLAQDVVAYERGALMTIEGDQVVSQLVRTPDGDPGKMTLSSSVLSRVLHDKEAILIDETRGDRSVGDAQSLVGQRIRSLACVPLMKDERVVGLLYLDSRTPGRGFTKLGLRRLTHLAHLAAVVIENRRLFEAAVEIEALKEELRKAAEIQQELLPKEMPPVSGYRLHALSNPCRAVGGDYYDCIGMPDGRVAIGLGDVAGKGMPAALMASTLQPWLQVFSEAGHAPVESVRRLNRVLVRRLPTNRFVSLFYAILDPVRHTLVAVNAAQGRPLLVRASGELVRLESEGPPLGIFDEFDYVERQIEFGPGDLLIAYTDGVTDAEDAAGRQLGEGPLTSIAGALRAEPPMVIAERIVEVIDQHHGECPQVDDVSLLLLQRTR